MNKVTVTDARKRFGALLDAVQHEPVLISQRNGKAAVIMSAEEYARFSDVYCPSPTRLEGEVHRSRAEWQGGCDCHG